MHQVQDSLIFLYIEEFLIVLITHFQEEIVTDVFVDLTLETDSFSEIEISCIGYHQDSVQDLYLHLNDLSIH